VKSSERETAGASSQMTRRKTRRAAVLFAHIASLYRRT
jgi:hypothetical protein